MTDIRPVDLPELRAEIKEQMAHPRLVRPLLNDLGIPSGSETEEFIQQLQEVVDEVELYHVAAPMTELACVAAEALDIFTPDRSDIPSEGGLIVFNGHVPRLITFEDGCTTPLRGVLWGAHSERPELVVIPIAEPHGGIPVPGRLIAYPFACFVAPLGQDLDKGAEAAVLRNSDILSLLLSTWLLMSQPLAELSEVEPDRAARKRLRRAGQEPKPVRVIELRRPKHTGATTGESGREYQHQWIVRGHWRQQWYPAREVHRPVWIAPHIKGPEGAPLIGGEKVYALKR